jgi:RNA polymerase sigma factor (sigma-70 family)
LTAVQTDIHKSLIEGSKLGDSRAQYQLYQLYSKAMFNICNRMMSHREEAEDMLQESFTVAFKRLGSFRYDSTFGAWLKRIVVNHCINELKRKKTELVLTDDMESHDKIEVEEEPLDMKLDVDTIKIAMSRLSDGYRIIFSLYLLEGYDHNEIAEILNISPSTSKSQFHRAKQKIKEIINKDIHERLN